MIITRYLTKEVFGTLFAVTLVLLLIFLSNQLVRFLGYAASGKLAANILLQLMGFEIPYLLALLLPLGLYLGIMLAYGRLYADSEMRVLHACGLSIRRLLKITSGIVILVAGLVLILMLWLNPWLANEKDKLIARSMTTENVLETLMPGRFQVGSDGKRVVYVEKVSRSRKKAENLFIAEQGANPADATNNTPWMVVSAAEGSQVNDPVTRDHFIVATDGYRYEGTPGQNAYKIIQFKKYSVLMPNTVEGSPRHEQEGVATRTLFSDYSNPLFAAELQWRLSIPLSALLLAFLAVPLSYVRPRQGKFAQLFPAVLLYIIYVNLLFVARNWVEAKTVSIGFGMWWVHILVLILAVWLTMLRAGWSVKRVIGRST